MRQLRPQLRLSRWQQSPQPQPPEPPPAPSAPPTPVPSPSAPPSLVPDGAKPGDPVEVNDVIYYVNFQGNGLSTTAPANAPSRVAPQATQPSPATVPVPVQRHSR